MLKNVRLSRTALAAIVAVVSLALAPAALASKSGHGGSPGSTAGSTVTVSPQGPYYFGEAISVTIETNSITAGKLRIAPLPRGSHIKHV